MPKPTMFTSEPLPGVQSPFYAGGQYYANAEDARRARAAMRACLWCGCKYSSGFGAFCSRECAMKEVAA